MALRFLKKQARERALHKALRGSEAPTFPSLTLKILQKIRDLDCPVSEIAESLQWDPGLVVRVLRTVNAAAYGPANPIQNVGHAVSYMGRGQLEQIVLAIAVRDALPKDVAPGFDSTRFWFSASRRAALARLFADKLHPAKQAESFTGGLLQDMAIPVLATSRPDDYGQVLQRWHEDPTTRLENLEQEAFGWTHADVGGLLGKTWELPDRLVGAIHGHHRSNLTDAQILPSLRLVSVLRETGEEHGIDAVVEVAKSDYGIEQDWTHRAVADAEKQAAELTQLMA